MPEAPKISSKPTDYNLVEKNKKTLQFIEDVTANADEVQKRVLGEILTRNANVEYLMKHGLKGHNDRETFKKVIPVSTYEDIQQEINRIANGDTSKILCSKPISEFLTRYLYIIYVTSYYFCFLLNFNSFDFFCMVWLNGFVLVFHGFCEWTRKKRLVFYAGLKKRQAF